MLPARFNTFDLPTALQFASWRDHYREVFDLDLAEGPRSPYMAEHTRWDVGGLTLTRASMPSNIVRHWRHWDKPKIDDWMLVVASNPTQTPSTRHIPRLTFRALARPFESDGSDGEVISLFLPREKFVKQAGSFDGIQPRIVLSGLAALMADYLLALEGQMHLLSGPELDRAAEATQSMLAACMIPVADNLARSRDTLDNTIVARAHKLIQRSLHLPGYGPTTLAIELGMSRSVLYRAFQPHGGISAVIRRERLNEAHHRLTSAANLLAIGDMALSLGFADHSTFARAFKQQFGYSPSDAMGRNHRSSLRHSRC